jgi:glutaredoxin
VLTIYTKSGCFHCENLKERLRFHEIPHEVKQLDIDISIDEIKAKFPMARSFPILATAEGKWIKPEEVNNYIKQNGVYYGTEDAGL